MNNTILHCVKRHPSFAAKMPALPTEVFALICAQSEISTLKQLRLANRTLSVLSAKDLFQEIYVMLLPDGVEKVRILISSFCALLCRYPYFV